MTETIECASLADEFVDYALEQTHPLVHAWRGSRIEADLRQAMQGAASLVTDEEAAIGYSETMSVLDLPPEHYKAKLLEIDGYRFLAQIDFPDVSGKSPFVAVFRGSRPLGAFVDHRVTQKIAASFDVFAPIAIRFFHPAHIEYALPNSRVDQYFLAGRACEMAARPDAPGLSRVVLTKSEDLAFYPRYVEAYEQVYAARPQLRGEVRIETEESLLECLSQGLLFEIHVDGRWAGIVAARHEMLAGVDAVYMVEILLDQQARGQALGPAVHQHLARHVVRSDPQAVISGTIAPVNLPSLKTAQRAGRVVIGAWHAIDV